jgi:transcription elongation factor Elf1
MQFKQEVGKMTCQKCNGLMIAESRPDYTTDGTVLRCINCGLVLDPLIEQNRLARMRATHTTLRAA